VYYWFEQHGRRTTSSYASKFYTILDSIQKGRTDAGLVRLVTPIEANEPESAADARLQAMLNDLFGDLGGFIPE
jgi:EpsI family protein